MKEVDARPLIWKAIKSGKNPSIYTISSPSLSPHDQINSRIRPRHDAQKRAQDEISSVVGSDRLPQLSDRERLPYVDALIQEVFRFHPGGPLGSCSLELSSHYLFLTYLLIGVPHSVTQDDYYEGMFIEKGSTIVSNIWYGRSDRGHNRLVSISS